MLEGLFTEMAQPIPPLFPSVPSVPSLKNQREPLQPTNDGAVPSVPPVPSQKTKTESKKQRILNWLAYIGETDRAVIDDTLNRCRADQETLRYFLTRANETQRASVAAKLANMQSGANPGNSNAAKNKNESANLRTCFSQTQAADMLSVSPRSVATANKDANLQNNHVTQTQAADLLSVSPRSVATAKKKSGHGTSGKIS